MLNRQSRPLTAVIDIGSNSVRLVVYDGMKRVPRPLFNEKVPCGLGRGIAETGHLLPQAREKARLSVARFASLAQLMGLETVCAVATAAIRDAADGRTFIEELNQEFGLNIRVISGEEEAALAAHAIMASIHHPQGIVADLGGGSLELVRIREETIAHQTTRPMGTLRLLDQCGDNPEAIRQYIREELQKIDRVHQGASCFYAIGGGFRSIAKVHMHLHHYPLPLVHHYQLNSETLFAFLSYLLTLSPEEHARLEGLSTRRIRGFIPSIIVLEEILRLTGAESVIFSHAGIREGLLYNQLDEKERSKDALLASLKNLMGKKALDTDYTSTLFRWQQPLFERESPRQRRLRNAACLLSEIALPVSASFRGEWAFEHLMQASLYGISHSERAALALALYHRYRKHFTLDESFLGLMDQHDQAWAKLAGSAADIAFMLSAGTEQLLEQVHLRIENSQVTLTGNQEALSMLPETVTNRIEGLGEIYNAFLSRCS